MTAAEIAREKGYHEVAALLAPPTFQQRLEKIGVNPDKWLCLISREVMSDPVTLSTGHTYDRSSLLKLQTYNQDADKFNCPSTRQSVSTQELKNGTNILIKYEIENYVTALEEQAREKLALLVIAEEKAVVPVRIATSVSLFHRSAERSSIPAAEEKTFGKNGFSNT